MSRQRRTRAAISRQGKSAGSSPLEHLILLAAVSWLVYLLIAALCPLFGFERYVSGHFVVRTLHALHLSSDRPIPLVLTAFAAVFGLYLWALRTAVLAGGDRRILPVIVIAAIVFRATLLFTEPIQEVDIYRYMWDGEVVAAGHNPYRYSPQNVAGAAQERQAFPSAEMSGDLAELVSLRSSAPAKATILDRVHHSQYTTVYPPISQAVFAAAAFTTPDDASVFTHLVVMKLWLLLFDLLTLWLVIRLLKIAGRPRGWALAYAWCPLLMKEVANSGHLDSIAVFFATLAVYLTATLFVSTGSSSRRCSLAMLALAAGVGAKLYPIVLAPLLLWVVWRKFGWRAAVLPAVTLGILSGLFVWPMLAGGPAKPQAAERSAPLADLPALPQPESNILPVKSDPAPQGLHVFLRQWEMNDFLFLVVYENLRPTDQLKPYHVAWFSVLPEDLRGKVVESAGPLSKDQERVPFLLTRLLTTGVFLALALTLAWRAARDDDVQSLLQAAFLTLAWFWLLSPTQNPWYWTWALPLLPFARGRAWLAVGGLVLLYYLRFWLEHHWPEPPHGQQTVLGTRYYGEYFFHFVVVVIEYVPWFGCLAYGFWRRR
ncbi:MAG: hypothetical protein IIA67_00765 [Planctomycetes bacterium]|nr:hypothetical protein [Planctomycetota bacterium]